MNLKRKVTVYLSLAILIVVSAGIITAEAFCTTYYNAVSTWYYSCGCTACAGYGGSCTECYDPESGASCHTSSEATCEPGGIDIRR